MSPRLAVLTLLSGCAAPPMGATFNAAEVFVEDDAERQTDRLARAVDGARHTLEVALPAGEDTALAESIVDAWDRGVAVRVVTDIDLADSPAIARLTDAGVPLTLADGAVSLFDFNLKTDMSWTSDQTLMSHGHVIVDDEAAWVGTGVGATGPGERVLLGLQGETIIEDLLSEHRQVYGGADATSPTAYDGMAKSIADFRWIYPTRTDVMLEVWFGPQERIGKRLIDAIYGARSSVKVLTGEFGNPGVAMALQRKAATGFDVALVIGSEVTFEVESPASVLLNDTPDLPVYQLPASVEVVPTLVLVDYEPARDGARSLAKAHVLSHALHSSTRLHEWYSEARRADEHLPVINDQFIDGVLLVLQDANEPSAELLSLMDVFDRHRQIAEPL